MNEVSYNQSTELVEFKRDGYIVATYPFANVYEALFDAVKKYDLTSSNTGAIRRRAKCLQFIQDNINSIDLS